MASRDITPISFKTVPGRNRTQKWSKAPTQTYDGDDWGGYDPYDDSEYSEPPPPMPTSQLPRDPYNGSPQLARASSFDRGDESRQFSAGQPSHFAGKDVNRQPSPATPQQHATPKDLSSSGSRPRDPEQVPPPLTANSPRASAEQFPPRRSSRSSGTPSLPATTFSPPTRETSPAVDKPLPFIRPADIYKRHAEELRRQSEDGIRPSLDSLSREKSPPPLDSVAENRESRMYETEEQPSPERLRVRDTSPTLPLVTRFSGFGTDFLTGSLGAGIGGHALNDGSSSSNTQAIADRVTSAPVVLADEPSSLQHTPTSAERDSAPAGLGNTDNADLQHRPSKGFRSAVDTAFDRNNDEISRDNSASSQQGSGEISPIMSRVPSGATATLERKRMEEQMPSIAETTPAGSRPASDSRGRVVSGDFEPGYRRSMDPPSTGSSPARTPALDNTANRRLSTPLSAVPMDAESADVLDQGAEMPSVNLEPTENSKPLAIKTRGRSGTDYSMRESDIANEINASSPDTGGFSPALLAAQKNDQALFLETHSDLKAPPSPMSPGGRSPGGKSQDGSRAGSPSKGRVREIADKFSGLDDAAGSRRNSAISVGSSKSSWSNFGEPRQGLSRPDTNRSLLGNEVERPGVQREESFVPDVPGGWISSAPTPEPGTGREPQYPQATPRAQRNASDEDIDLTPTTKKHQLRGSGSHQDSPTTLEQVKNAGAQLGASLLSATGMGHQTRDFASSESAAPREETPEPRMIRGDQPMQPPMYRHDTENSEAPTSIASSMPPTPISKETPAGETLSSDYFKAVAPLRVKSREATPPGSREGGLRPQVTSAYPSEMGPGDMESDRLRKEIVRSLDPIPHDEAIEDTQRTQDALDAPTNERRVEQGLPTLPAAETSRQPGLLQTRFSWEAPSAPELVHSPEIKPEMPYERGTSKTLHVMNVGNETPDTPTVINPTQQESEDGVRDESYLSPITEADGSMPPASPRRSLQDVPPSPMSTHDRSHINDDAHAGSGRISSDARQSSDARHSSDARNASLDAPASSSPISHKTAPPPVRTSAQQPHKPIPPFRSILALKTSEDRIASYNETRTTFAEMNTGLSDWLRAMSAQHSDITAAPLGPPPALGVNTGAGSTSSLPSGFLKGHKNSPSLAKFTRNFSGSGTGLDSGGPGSSSAGPVGGQRNVSSSSGAPAQDGDSSRPAIDTEELKLKGKAFMQKTGVLGGKAQAGAKGLFAKGRSRFGGGGGGEKDRGSTFFARTLRIDYELQTAYDAGIDRSTPIIPEAEGEGGGKAGRTLRPGDQDVRLDWSMPEGESDAKAGQADEKVTALDKKVPARRSSIIYPSKRLSTFPAWMMSEKSRNSTATATYAAPNDAPDPTSSARLPPKTRDSTTPLCRDFASSTITAPVLRPRTTSSLANRTPPPTSSSAASSSPAHLRPRTASRRPTPSHYGNANLTALPVVLSARTALGSHPPDDRSTVPALRRAASDMKNVTFDTGITASTDPMRPATALGDDGTSAGEGLDRPPSTTAPLRTFAPDPMRKTGNDDPGGEEVTTKVPPPSGVPKSSSASSPSSSAKFLRRLSSQPQVQTSPSATHPPTIPAAAAPATGSTETLPTKVSTSTPSALPAPRAVASAAPIVSSAPVVKVGDLPLTTSTSVAVGGGDVVDVPRVSDTVTLRDAVSPTEGSNGVEDERVFEGFDGEFTMEDENGQGGNLHADGMEEEVVARGIAQEDGRGVDADKRVARGDKHGAETIPAYVVRDSTIASAADPLVQGTTSAPLPAKKDAESAAVPPFATHPVEELFTTSIPASLADAATITTPASNTTPTTQSPVHANRPRLFARHSSSRSISSLPGKTAKESSPSRPLSMLFGDWMREKSRSRSRSRSSKSATGSQGVETPASQPRSSLAIPKSSTSRPSSLVLHESAAEDSPIAGHGNAEQPFVLSDFSDVAVRATAPDDDAGPMSPMSQNREEAWNSPDATLPLASPAAEGKAVGRLGVLPSPAPTAATFESGRRASMEPSRRRSSAAPLKFLDEDGKPAVVLEPVPSEDSVLHEDNGGAERDLSSPPAVGPAEPARSALRKVSEGTGVHDDEHDDEKKEEVVVMKARPQHQRKVSDRERLPSQLAKRLSEGRPRPDSMVLAHLNFGSEESWGGLKSPGGGKKGEMTAEPDTIVSSMGEGDVGAGPSITGKRASKLLVEPEARDDARSEVSAEHPREEEGPQPSTRPSTSRRSSVSSLGVVAGPQIEQPLGMSLTGAQVADVEPSAASPNGTVQSPASIEQPAVAKKPAYGSSESMLSPRRPMMDDRGMSYTILPRDASGLPVPETITTTAQSGSLQQTASAGPQASSGSVDLSVMGGPPAGTPPFQQHPVFRSAEQERDGAQETVIKESGLIQRSVSQQAQRDNGFSGAPPPNQITDDHGLDDIYAFNQIAPGAQPQQETDAPSAEKQGKRRSMIWDTLKHRRQASFRKDGDDSRHNSMATPQPEARQDSTAAVNTPGAEEAKSETPRRATLQQPLRTQVTMAEKASKKKRFSALGSLFGLSGAPVGGPPKASVDNSPSKPKKLTKAAPSEREAMAQSPVANKRIPDSSTVSGNINDYDQYEAARKRDMPAYQDTANNAQRQAPQPRLPNLRPDATAGLAQPPPEGWYGSPTEDEPAQRTMSPPQAGQLHGHRRLHSEGGRGYRAGNPVPESFSPVEPSYNAPVDPIGPSSSQDTQYYPAESGYGQRRSQDHGRFYPYGAPVSGPPSNAPRQLPWSDSMEIPAYDQRQGGGQPQYHPPYQRGPYGPPDDYGRRPSRELARSPAHEYAEQQPPWALAIPSIEQASHDPRSPQWTTSPDGQYPPPDAAYYQQQQYPQQRRNLPSRPSSTRPYPPVIQHNPGRAQMYDNPPPRSQTAGPEPQSEPRRFSFDSVGPHRPQNPPRQSHEYERPRQRPASTQYPPQTHYSRAQPPPPRAAQPRYYAQQQSPQNYAPHASFGAFTHQPPRGGGGRGYPPYSRRPSSGYSGRRDDPTVGEEEVIMRGASYPGQEWTPMGMGKWD
ncbi:unnamed protein product [Zymoseptoria tritici ST99CH_1E4]|uniref:Uncharacterized protein n=1 Tax=Zymoseptoria tritici ST99CH_1E4 TaxID=1276532 RepID=A0A2H1H8E6_ZYMTR|nr:unnamed protein product [Zymoseptoria tritici ST99CH_1E4]